MKRELDNMQEYLVGKMGDGSWYLFDKFLDYGSLRLGSIADDVKLCEKGSFLFFQPI